MKKLSPVAGPQTFALTIPTLLASLTLGGALSLSACGGQSGPAPAAPTAPGSAAPPATVLVEPAPTGSAAATPAPGLVTVATPPAEPPVVLKDVGFKTPESVLYDAGEDVYLVSNINGKPTDADGNGFISKVSPDGKVLDLKWIDGTKPGSKLDAPKGLAIAGDTLYVADLTVVRMFDRKTGASKGKIAALGSTFLNDVSVAADGTVYVSDSGLKMGKEGLEPDGSDAIYKIGKAKRADKLIAGKDLHGPNGVLADDKGVWVVTFGAETLYHVGLDGKKEPDQKLPVGSLDGLVKLPDGSLLVSSWASSSVMRGTLGGTFEPVISDVKSPADIGYDSKRNVVLIPLFLLDTVQLQKLPGAAPVAAATSPAATPGASATPAAAPATAKPAPAGAPAPAAAPAPMAAGKPSASFPSEQPGQVPAAPAPAAKVPAAAPAPAAKVPATAPAPAAKVPATAPAVATPPK